MWKLRYIAVSCGQNDIWLFVTNVWSIAWSKVREPRVQLPETNVKHVIWFNILYTASRGSVKRFVMLASTSTCLKKLCIVWKLSCGSRSSFKAKIWELSSVVELDLIYGLLANLKHASWKRPDIVCSLTMTMYKDWIIVRIYSTAVKNVMKYSFIFSFSFTLRGTCLNEITLLPNLT